MAGRTGLDTWRMTLREIVLANQAKIDHDLHQTASMLAAIYNIRPRGKHDTRNFTPSDFYRADNHTPQRSTCGNRLTIGLLRQLKGKLFPAKESNACKSE